MRSQHFERAVGVPIRVPGSRGSIIRGPMAVLASLVTLAGCSLGEAPPPAPPEAPVLEGLPIREGVVTEAESREAARLVQEAERLLSEGRAAEALERASEVERRLAAAPGSSRAVWIIARAARALESWEDARSAAESYVAIVPPGSPEAEQASVLRADVMRSGTMPGGIESIFEVPEAPSDPQLVAEIEDLAAEWATELETSALRDLVAEAPPHRIVLPVFQTEFAVRRFFSGAQDEARELAEEALALGAGPDAAERARGVLEGDVDATMEVAGVLGGILPSVGSPTVRQLAQEVRDGVEVALAVEEGDFSRPIRFVPVDDASNGAEVTSAIRSLEADGTVAVIGPLEASLLEEAARARTAAFPLLSPTAPLVPEGVPGVYSLTGVDPSASEALAQLALARGVRRVVVLQTAMAEMDRAAAWFRNAYTAGGGSVIRGLTYAPGTTQFEAQMTEILRLRPDGLVLLVPPGDVELVAPQISFYGVDGLPGLTRLGNESWTSEAVLSQVQPRHMNGVLSVTSWAETGEFGPGWSDFVSAYEEHFRRTLRSPTPALGYDAARLLSRAAREGGGSADRTREAFERIEDFPGATGLLSVDDGQIRRAFTPVRIQDRRLVPLSPR